MYTSDTAIVQDLKASILFLNSNLADLATASSADTIRTISELPEQSRAVYALGLRHSQRLLVDALVKAFMVIVKDIDNVQLKSFDALLDAMQRQTAQRDAVLDTEGHRNIFVARMLANAASLLVTPAPSVEEAAHAAQASIRTVTPGVRALEVFLKKISIPD